MNAAATLVQVEINPFLMTLLIGTVLPLLVGVATKLSTKPIYKSLLLIFFDAVTTLLSGAAMVGSSYVLSRENLITGLFAFLASVGTYTGLWKSAGLTSSARSSGRPGLLARVGVSD
jgi:hypothetical protein